MYCIWYGTHFESFISCVKKWFYAFFLFWWQFGFLLCCFSFLWSFFAAFIPVFVFVLLGLGSSGLGSSGLASSGLGSSGLGLYRFFSGNGVSPFSLCWSWSNFLGIATFSEDKGCFFRRQSRSHLCKLCFYRRSPFIFRHCIVFSFFQVIFEMLRSQSRTLNENEITNNE